MRGLVPIERSRKEIKIKKPLSYCPWCSLIRISLMASVSVNIYQVSLCLVGDSPFDDKHFPYIT